MIPQEWLSTSHMHLESTRKKHCRCLTYRSKQQGKQLCCRSDANTFIPTDLHYLYRQNLWQSLYITDCFLASSLGRPNTITCETASELCSMSDQPFSKAMSQKDSSLFFSVNVSKIVGEILSRVYYKRKASRSIAHLLSLRFNEWMRELPPDLHWRGSEFQSQNPDLILRRLHINLIYFNGIILLTRPFLLYEINKKLSEPVNESPSRNIEQSGSDPRAKSGRPEQAYCFHGACVRSALHSIIAINAAFSANALPRRDPFVMQVHPAQASPEWILIDLQLLAIFGGSCGPRKHILPCA
jgi:hypothetical protein